MYSDPTMPNTAPSYPYADFSPYQLTPIPPPPPRKKTALKVAIISTSVVLALVLLGATTLLAYTFGKDNSTAKSIATPLATPTIDTNTSVVSSYTANDIISDFAANNLSVSQLQAQSLNQYLDGWAAGESSISSSESIVTTQPTSSVFFRDATACVGPCDTGGDTFLAVYASVTDAQSSLDQVKAWTTDVNNCGCTPYQMPNDDIQYGRCLLITYEPPTTGYALIEYKYCV